MKSINNVSLGFLTISIMLLSACKKEWLDAKSNKNQNVPSTLADFQSMLDNTSVMNKNTLALGEIAADGHHIPESAWDAASSNNAKNAYTWSHNLPYNKLLAWNYLYERILYNNVVIGGINKMKNDSSDETDLYNVLGQALFNRSEAFFQLAQLYAPAYDGPTANNTLGIPLRLGDDVSERSERASLKQTYEQILNDSKRSADLLPAGAMYSTRGSRAAAYGLLARTYLVMQDYDSAFKYADSCLQLNSVLIDYATETIPTQSSFGLFPKEVIFHNSMYTSDLSGFVTSSYLVDTSLYNLYVSDDLRKTRFFKINEDSTIVFIGNYNNTTTNLFCGIATDEVYLIRAECYARNGDKTNAMDDLNTLLEKRFSTPFIPYTAPDAEKALEIILQERRKELILRNLRWSDLKRLNRESRFQVNLVRTVGGNTYTLPPNSYQYTFPIPDDVISISGMLQSEGW